MENKRERVERGLHSAIADLKKQQHEAMERATFLGMNSEEKAAYDDRAERINLLQSSLDNQPAEPPEVNGHL